MVFLNGYLQRSFYKYILFVLPDNLGFNFFRMGTENVFYLITNYYIRVIVCVCVLIPEVGVPCGTISACVALHFAATLF